MKLINFGSKFLFFYLKSSLLSGLSRGRIGDVINMLGVGGDELNMLGVCGGVLNMLGMC
jgi:hypothetical protein